ncbi:heterokaryon incompatibility protein-domain-containing protein [Biscogniauxia mediterranea]|nr:heterokaryon incompatibility protein-domain-containing protein [Biscogniauxia mediterranea]
MRLLNTETFRLQTFDGSEKPSYAILSHTWGKDEVLFEDIYKKPGSESEWRGKGGASKVIGAVQQAIRNEYKYIWIDTCCIDKSSSAELSEAINSMFSWYEEANTCYAYMSDVTRNDEESFKSSRWFTRGWTLQELIAPREVQFFDSQWTFIETRSSMAPLLESITQIRPLTSQRCNLFQRDPFGGSSRTLLDSYSVCNRMSWTSQRVTTRTEDIAYCLMGIFDVHMPLLYGEGTRAFRRLQEEIIKQSNDHSILLHEGNDLLASSPRAFNVNLYLVNTPLKGSQALRMFHDSIELNLLLYESNSDSYGILDIFLDEPSQTSRVAIPIRHSNGQWVRVSTLFDIVKPDGQGRPRLEDHGIILSNALITRETIRIFERASLALITPLDRSIGTRGSVVVKKIIRSSDCPAYQYGRCVPRLEGNVIALIRSGISVSPNMPSLYAVASIVDREAAIPCLWALVVGNLRDDELEAWIVHPREFLGPWYGDNPNLSYPDSFYGGVPALAEKDIQPAYKHKFSTIFSYMDKKRPITYITPDGILIGARVIKSTFLETPLFHLEVRCSRVSSKRRRRIGTIMDISALYQAWVSLA